MCRETSGDGLAPSVLLISMGNWDLCLASLPRWQEEPSHRLLWVTHRGATRNDAGAWGADSPAAPAVRPASGVQTAGRELPRSC